jgi:hypothetical protein
LPRLVSTRFVDRRIPFVSTSRFRSWFRASARASVRGARLLPPPRFESTASCRLFLSGTTWLLLPASRSVEGRGFYHRRVLSQPLWRLSYFVCQPRRPMRISRSRGRGLYHHRVQGQQPSSALFFPPFVHRRRAPARRPEVHFLTR